MQTDIRPTSDLAPPHPIRPPRLLGYARVSTGDQSLDLQMDALERAGCYTVYSEKASGRIQARLELERCLKALQPGDTFVVWKLDRMARSLQHSAELFRWFQERGITFRSIQDGIDTSTTYGRAQAGMAAVFAELESDMIRERTMAGLLAARARGRKGGRKPKMTPTRRKVALDMYDSRQHTITAIAKTLGVSARTIYRSLGDDRTKESVIRDTASG